MHLQNKALRLGMFFSRFLVFCLIAAVMAGSVPPASAVVIDVGSGIGSFIDWSMDLGAVARNTLFSFFNEDVCPQSTESNGRHVYEKMKTTVDGRPGYYNICKYCGKSAGAIFSSSGRDNGFGSNKVKEDLGTTVLSSANTLLWSPAHSWTLVATASSGKNGVYCSHHAAGLTGPQVEFNCTAGSSNFFVSPAEGKSSFNVYCHSFGYSSPAPVTGSYRLLGGNASILRCANPYDSSERLYTYKYEEASVGANYNKGAEISLTYESPFIINSSFATEYIWKSYYAQGYAPVYEVIPASELLPAITQNYNIQSRSNSYQGNFGIIGDNGEITKIENQYIVNETDNSVYNPVTNTTNTIQSWTYDYSNRTYNLTYDNGMTAVVTYGDEYVIINEGDTVYNVYYLVSGSDSENPGPGPGPGDSSSGGSEGGGSIWKKLGELIGTLFGTIIEVMEGVVSKLLDALISLAERLRDGIVKVVGTVLSIFDELPALFDGFLDFLGIMFPFLPPEIVTLITFGVAAVVFIGIIKAIRR